ncbi:MAG: tRNA dihydrouridine synthase DusB, partial [Ruminococcaceae bacterium]|nr:tRNA dihydrouridine synthase DusB [Oscillospiraceae bacterium]
EYTVTEMVSAKAIHFQDTTSKILARIDPQEAPTALQLFGHEPDIMAEAVACMLHPEDGYAMPAAIDINMGCPVRKIVNNGDGSALMRNPELAGRVIRAAVDASTIPVTVKIRTGWDENSRNAVKLAKIAEENGASLLCVHGRTREQMYSPPIDLETIARVKAAVSIPVIGNGGINTVEEALTMRKVTGCDGLMIARGAMGNPWLFEEIAAAIDGRSYHRPDLPTRLNEALCQVDDMILDKGEHIGVLESRRQLAYYIKGISGAADVRGRLNRAETREEIHSIIESFLKN